VNIEQFKYIIAIAEKKSLSKAADSLYISQSALTQFLTKLERQLGVKLFTRENGSWSPTQAGDILLISARVITNEYQKAQYHISQISENRRNLIKFGISTDRASALYHPIFNQFLSRYPGIQIELHEGQMFDTQKMLMDGEVTLCYAHKPFCWQKEERNKLEPVFLIEEPLFLTVPRQHRFCSAGCRRPVPLCALQGEHIIIHGKKNASSMLVGKLLEQSAIDFKASVSVTSNRLALESVKNGTGITFLPPLFTQDRAFWGPEASVRVVPLETPIVWKVGVFKLMGYELNEAERFLCTLLKYQHQKCIEAASLLCTQAGEEAPVL